MIISKMCDENLHQNYCTRVLDYNSPYIIEIPANTIFTYRSVSEEDFLCSTCVFEQAISFRNQSIYNLLHNNIDKFHIFEKLPSICEYKLRNDLTSIETKFLSEVLILSDINIVSNKHIVIKRTDTIGNIFFVTDDKNLYSIMKLRL